MLLDILIEDSIYPELTEKVIQTQWIETEGETIVNVPSIDATGRETQNNELIEIGKELSKFINRINEKEL